MTNEIYLISTVVATLAAVVSYLIAISKGKQALATTNEDLSVANAAISQFEMQLAVATEQEKKLRYHIA